VEGLLPQLVMYTIQMDYYGQVLSGVFMGLSFCEQWQLLAQLPQSEI